MSSKIPKSSRSVVGENPSNNPQEASDADERSHIMVNKGDVAARISASASSSKNTIEKNDDEELESLKLVNALRRHTQQEAQGDNVTTPPEPPNSRNSQSEDTAVTKNTVSSSDDEIETSQNAQGKASAAREDWFQNSSHQSSSDTNTTAEDEDTDVSKMIQASVASSHNNSTKETHEDNSVIHSVASTEIMEEEYLQANVDNTSQVNPKQMEVASAEINIDNTKDSSKKRVSFSEESTQSFSSNFPSGSTTEQTNDVNSSSLSEQQSTSADLPKAVDFDLGDIQEEEGEEGEEQKEWQRRKSRRTLQIVLSFVAIAIVLGVAFLLAALFAFKRQRDSTDTITISPTTAPTLPPTLSLDNYVWDLLRNYIGPAVEVNSNAPQAQAFNWLIQDPYLYEGFFLGDYPDWRIQQRFALASLYYSTGGRRWFNSTNWLSYDHHECEWYAAAPRTCGVFDCVYDTFNYTSPCDESSSPTNRGLRQYTSLRLNGNHLQGHLQEELYWLTSLEEVQLWDNRLLGTLSTRLGKLHQLQTLDVSSNQLWGSIPSEIFTTRKIPQLQDLVLSNNFLVGTIPTSIGRARNLINLLLDENGSIFGSIPSEIGLLSENLRVVYLDNCDLTDAVPSELGLLSQLDTFHLSGNELSSLPSELGQLTKLVDIDISNNPQLSGRIPEALCLVESLDFDCTASLCGCACPCVVSSSETSNTISSPP